MKWSIANIVLAFVAGFLVYQVVDSEAAGQTRLGLALFACIAWLWISEALHISVTALLVPLGASLLGIADVRAALENFAHPVIFLFMGGFALATALKKYELDRAFAIRLLALSDGRPARAILLMFTATALLSMWISNTATVAMMLPLALGLLATRDPEVEPRLYLFTLLGLAYAGNIGGMATLIGSPPNAIAGSAIGLSFTEWLAFGLPAFLLLFPLMLLLLWLSIRPAFGDRLTLAPHDVPPDRHRLLVPVIFALTAAGWIGSSLLGDVLGIDAGVDTLVALAAIVLLIATGSLRVPEFVAGTNWGVLILFGGGLTLSSVLQDSGASSWLAEHLAALLPGESPWLMLLVVSLFTIFLSEVVSNTASAALLIPLFLSVAVGLGFPEHLMAVLIALSASCACMLPVATPPNALAYSSGFVPQRQMMRIGMLLNVSFALTLSGFMYLLSR